MLRAHLASVFVSRVNNGELDSRLAPTAAVRGDSSFSATHQTCAALGVVAVDFGDFYAAFVNLIVRVLLLQSLPLVKFLNRVFENSLVRAARIEAVGR